MLRPIQNQQPTLLSPPPKRVQVGHPTIPVTTTSMVRKKVREIQTCLLRDSGSDPKQHKCLIDELQFWSLQLQIIRNLRAKKEASELASLEQEKAASDQRCMKLIQRIDVIQQQLETSHQQAQYERQRANQTLEELRKAQLRIAELEGSGMRGTKRTASTFDANNRKEGPL